MNGAPDADIAVFTQALGLPPEERDRYLDAACKGDIEFRRRVEALLLAYEHAGDFLGRPAAERPLKAAQVLAAGEKPGAHIGHYKLLEQIGEGGYGVVYMAEQQAPVRRRVALKIIKPGMDTKSVIARFEAERQALALMNHPNIAKVFDAGATEAGRPYFVMELVRGVKITEHCNQQLLTTEDRLRVFVQVCHAVQHAHQKGIIHRDIKPSNILVTQSLKGVATPLVIDFGVAKATTDQRLTDKTVFTAFEMLIGTPAYMSPEQAALSSVDVDTRTDIYSLGVLLYELLTSSTPFETEELLKAGLDEIRKVIREQEPLRPSTRLSKMARADLTTVAQQRRSEPPRLIHMVRGDLDWIAMKALEKDRGRRYQTADSLADDIHRYLENETVSARPPSRVYQFRKLVSRHKLGFAAVGIVMVTLVAGLSITIWSLAKEKKARHDADLARIEANDQRKKAQAGEQNALTEAARSKAVTEFLKRMLGGVDPSVSAGYDTFLLRQILDHTVEGMEQQLTNQPAVEADLKVIIGGVYGSLRMWKQQESLLLSAAALYRKSPAGAEQKIADTLAAATNANLMLAKLKEEKPEYGARWPADEAHARYEVAVRRSSIMLGLDDPRFDESLQVLARLLTNKGKAEEGADIYRELLGVRRKHLGDKDSRVAETVTELARALVDSHNEVQVEQLARDFPIVWITRSEESARHGLWSEAMAAASRFLEIQPGDHSGYHVAAPLLVQTGERAAYEQLCETITARFAGATDPYTADRMAKDCLILSRPGADLKVPGELAETAVTKGEKDTGSLPFFQCCKALAEYRLGYWEGATNWANRAAANSSPYVRAEANAILAMAQFQFKHVENARDALNRCAEVVRTELPKFTDKDLGSDWRDLIIAHALQSEAKQLIDGEPSIARPANLPQ